MTEAFNKFNEAFEAHMDFHNKLEQDYQQLLNQYNALKNMNLLLRKEYYDALREGSVFRIVCHLCNKSSHAHTDRNLEEIGFCLLDNSIELSEMLERDGISNTIPAICLKCQENV